MIFTIKMILSQKQGNIMLHLIPNQTDLCENKDRIGEIQKELSDTIMEKMKDISNFKFNTISLGHAERVISSVMRDIKTKYNSEDIRYSFHKIVM
jgi:hypothetical protein